MWILTRSYTNQALQLQKMGYRVLKFGMYEVVVFYYPSREKETKALISFMEKNAKLICVFVFP